MNAKVVPTGLPHPRPSKLTLLQGTHSLVHARLLGVSQTGFEGASGRGMPNLRHSREVGTAWAPVVTIHSCSNLCARGGPGGVWLRDKAQSQGREKVLHRVAAKITNCFSAGLGRPRLQTSLLRDPPELGETKRLQGAGLRREVGLNMKTARTCPSRRHFCHSRTLWRKAPGRGQRDPGSWTYSRGQHSSIRVLALAREATT